jgi:rod shape-determining protein MreD
MDVLKTCFLLLLTTIVQAIGSSHMPSIMYLDLPLIVTMYYSIQGRKMYSAVVGSLVGLMQDAISGIPLGINGLSKALAGYIAGVISKRVVVESPMSQFVLLLVSSIGNAGVTLLLFLLIGRRFSPTFLRQAGLQAGVTAIVGLMLLRLLNRNLLMSNRFKTKAAKYEP